MYDPISVLSSRMSLAVSKIASSPTRASPVSTATRHLSFLLGLRDCLIDFADNRLKIFRIVNSPSFKNRDRGGFAQVRDFEIDSERHGRRVADFSACAILVPRAAIVNIFHREEIMIDDVFRQFFNLCARYIFGIILRAGVKRPGIEDDFPIALDQPGVLNGGVDPAVNPAAGD
jgi:hypothetical protein